VDRKLWKKDPRILNVSHQLERGGARRTRKWGKVVRGFRVVIIHDIIGRKRLGHVK